MSRSYVFSGDALAVHRRMMLAAHFVRCAFDLVMADPWATFDVAVNLSHAHPDAADECYLSNVATKAAPEIVGPTGRIASSRFLRQMNQNRSPPQRQHQT